MRCSCGHENPDSAARCPRCGRLPARPLDPGRLAFDVVAGAGLVVALAVIWGLDPEEPSQPGNHLTTAVVEEPAPVDGQSPLPSARRTLRLAVTPPEYDDMGKLLATLGSGYQYTQIPMDTLLDADRLATYDVIFLTCGGVPEEWLGRRVGEGDRDAAGSFNARRWVVERLHDALRRFVARGGTLYASDWQLQLLEIAFPEFIDSSKRARGAVQTVRAEVVDEGLARRLGPFVELRFDKGAWYPAAFRDRDVTICLRGAFSTLEGRQASGPLLVKFPFESGNVVFTSFHNESQNTQTEMELLRYLVFTTVTAREEANVKRTMVRGGFSPTQRNLLSASKDSQPVAQVYECRRRGPLQFVLGFEDRGARLRLTVTEPGGRQHEQAGVQTFSLDIPDGQPGTWRYAITPLEVPFQNFPFTLTIGEKP